MQLEIRHTRQARQDLREIWDYIDQTDTAAADRQLRRIAEKVIQTSHVPMIGSLARSSARSFEALSSTAT